MINYMNKEFFDLCLDNQKIEFMQRSIFAVNHDLNYDFFWKGKIHTSNIGFRQLAKDFVPHIRVKNVNILSF